MLQAIISFMNRIMLTLNVLVLVGLLGWSLAGIWEYIPTDSLLFWKVFMSLIAVLTFNVLTVFLVSYLYRKTLKLVDVFHESDYAVEHPEGDIIFSEGQRERVMYLIVKGKIELVADNDLLEVVGPGEFFGEMAIIDDMPRSATAVCKTACKVIPITDKRFYELLQELPFFAKEIMRVMSRRIRRHPHLHPHSH